MNNYSISQPLFEIIKNKLNPLEINEVKRILGYELINTNQVY